MIARDRTKPKTDYKGREFGCSDAACPCRLCCNNHDCGYEQKVYKNGLWTSSKHITRMECATRHNSGCPDPKPEPLHIYQSDRSYKCLRCGYSRKPVSA